MLRNDGVTQQEAGHAWAEADVEGLGWVGFDPANGICPTEGHVRVAVGLDYLGAAPVRGTRQGGADEQMRSPCRSTRRARSGRVTLAVIPAPRHAAYADRLAAVQRCMRRSGLAGMTGIEAIAL